MEPSRADWVLVELVGGPKDSSILEVTVDALDGVLVDLGSAASNGGGYNQVWGSAGLDDRGGLSIVDEQSAIARLGRGSPEFCLRLFWTEQTAASRAGSGRPGELHDLIEPLLVGDEAAARAVADQVADYVVGPVELIDVHLAPALRDLGERWKAGRLSIYQGHRAASIVRCILAGTRGTLGSHRRGRAVTAVLSGDLHSIPSEMAAQALRDDGWQVEELGANTPPETLLLDLEPAHADLVVLSPTMAVNQALSLATAVKLRERGFSVLVGSPGSALVDLQRQAAL